MRIGDLMMSINAWAVMILFEVCSHCKKTLCLGCDDVNMCSGNDWECGKVSCAECRNEGAEGIVDGCDNEYCDRKCGECRWRECCNGSLDCEDCKAKVFGRVVEENRLLQAKVELLSGELCQLRFGNRG